MLKYIAAYGGTAVAFVALDALWLRFAAMKMYRPVENILLSGSIKPLPAVLFYVLFITGIVYFAVRPAMASGQWSTAAVGGALFGLIGYATYAFTNHAVMRGWTWSMSLTDIAWGAFASAVAATAGFFVVKLVVR